MVACDDLKLGGTLSPSGLSGGFSINNTALSVADWSTLFGTVGMSGVVTDIYGRPGGYAAGDMLPLQRALTLSVNVHRWPASVEECTPSEVALLENTDTFLAELSKRAGTYLEVVLPDATTRFTHVLNMDPAPMLQPAAFRSFSVPLIAPWGHWWAGGAESTASVSGASTVTVTGGQAIYDAQLVFPGNGTFTHSTLGWSIEVVNAAGAVTVDLGRRVTLVSGVPTSNRIRRTPAGVDPRVWGWFTPGSNNVTSTVAVTVNYRNQFL